VSEPAEQDEQLTRPSLADLPLREDLRGREPYGAPQLTVPVRLNTNENSYPVPAEVVEAMAKAVAGELRDLNRYPDRDAVALRGDLADYLTARHGRPVGADQVWAANGSNEILQQLLQAFGGPGRTALGFTPAYSMHPLIALATGTAWVDGPRRPDFTIDASAAVDLIRDTAPDVVFICSPNNPTGTAVSPATLAAIARVAPGMVVVDEAYAEFARPGTSSSLDLLDAFPRLVVTRTMSKAFALAGARLGYFAAAPAVVDAVQLVRLPYHLSALTQAVARAALAHADTMLATVDAIKVERDRIVHEIRAMGLRVADSDANFVLFGGFPGDDQRRVWQALLRQGVLIRDVGLPGWLRVTAGTPGETDAFLAALRSVRAAGDGQVPLADGEGSP
jgi:histidinol-phosphate aminotransferase